MRLIPTISLASLLIATPCAAQRQPSYLATVSGSCSEMTIADEDRSSECPATLFNLAYVDNTSSFRLVTEEGLVVSFFGDDNEAVGNKATLVVRTIYFTPVLDTREGESLADRTARAAKATLELPAMGQCEYTNPDLPDNYIRCEATAAGKTYSFKFSASDFRITDLGGRIRN